MIAFCTAWASSTARETSLLAFIPCLWHVLDIASMYRICCVFMHKKLQYLFCILCDFNFMFCRNFDQILSSYDVNSTALVQAVVESSDTLWMSVPSVAGRFRLVRWRNFYQMSLFGDTSEGGRYGDLINAPQPIKHRLPR